MVCNSASSSPPKNERVGREASRPAAHGVKKQGPRRPTLARTAHIGREFTQKRQISTTGKIKIFQNASWVIDFFQE